MVSNKEMIVHDESYDSAMETLVKSFFKGSLPDFKQENIKTMTWDAQEKFLNQTIRSPRYKKYPGSISFIRLFFKNLIKSLELEQEVHDDMYNHLCCMMEIDGDNFSYRHYLIDNSLDNVVTVRETKNLVLNGTTGLRTWEAGFMLTDWALCNKEIFSNKLILELGSGVGFTGITIVKHCSVKSMIMTDFHDEVLETINTNVLINFPTSKSEHENNSTIYKSDNYNIGVMKLDWNDINNNLPQNLKPDIIIGADIVYDPSILQPLIEVFEFFQNQNEDLKIYIASVIRNADTFNKFLNILEVSKFKHTTLPITRNVHVEWNEIIEKCLLRINKDI